MKPAMYGRPWIALAAALALLQLPSGCASVRPDVPRVASYAVADGDGDGTTLGRAFAPQSIQHPGLSGFQVVAEGRAAFVMRAAMADAAERALDLQYYSAGDDLTSDLLLLRIVAAAERGVRVRILLDDTHPPTRAFARRAMAANAGIQVRLFNPFFVGGTSSLARLGEFVFDSKRLNRRMHNKLWVTDNALAVVGSRNLGDEYFDSHQSFNFLDVDLLAAGPIVGDLSQAFDTYWNNAAAVPMEAISGLPDAGERALAIEQMHARAARCEGRLPCQWLAEDRSLQALRAADVPLTWSPARLISDPPDDDKTDASSGLAHGAIDHPGASGTRAELLIVSPYFVPSAQLHDHLGEMHERGVRVAVLTNSLASTDVPAAHAGYARHRAALLREGVELYEVRPEPGVRIRRGLLRRWAHASASSLHAKVIVEDRRRASVGSLNQDPRSRRHNTEACIVLESPELAAELAALFEEATDLHEAFKVEQRKTGSGEALGWSAQEGAEIVHYDTEPLSGLWLRLWRGVLGAVIPEHHL